MESARSAGWQHGEHLGDDVPAPPVGAETYTPMLLSSKASLSRPLS